MKAIVGAFNQEMARVGAFSVIVQPVVEPMDRFTALIRTGEIGANGKPTVKCEVCGKKLADPSSLYRHRKIHSGDKPHKCPYCERWAS